MKSITFTIIVLLYILSLLTPVSYSSPAIPRYNLSSSQYPIGVASTYNIHTSEVLGYVNITQISTSSASLQLNAVVKGVNSFGETYYFLVQNIVEFNGNKYDYSDEVWNLTSPYANINKSFISGNGNVYSTDINGHTVTYYSYSTSYNQLSLPFSTVLKISVSFTGSYISIVFSYTTNSGEQILDNVVLGIDNVQKACIYVSSSPTGAGVPSDVELVWGGSGNGQSVSFSQLRADLAIFYEVEPDLYSPFPIVSNYGQDVQESASNLQATLGNDGLVYVTVGTPNPQTLTNFFTPLVPGWSEVTVISNETYSINGYNFTYNSPKSFSSADFGLPYFISFISPKPVSVTLYTFKEDNHLIYPYLVTIIQPYANTEYNTTKTTFTVPANAYYLIVARYKEEPLMFYVSINIPMWGIVNNTAMLVKSGYYYYGTIIELFINYTYVNSFERYVLIPNITQFIVIENITVYVSKVLQYYVQVSTEYPLYTYVNGMKTQLTSNWFNASLTINVPYQIYYVSNYQREVLLNPITITLNSPVNYTAKWETQYYVNITSQYPLKNVENETLNSTWYNASSKLIIPPQFYYASQNQREMLLNPISIEVDAPINYAAKWETQYYVYVNFPVNATINGKSEVLTSGWYNESTEIVINQNPQYVGKLERVYIYNKLPISIVVDSPKRIIINATVQFYVEFQMPVIGKINGSTQNLTTNWYNIYTVIQLNNTYFSYISNVERVMYIPSTTYINVTGPVNITFKKVLQFYVFFNSSLPLENNQGQRLSNAWYNYSDKIVIPFQFNMINSTVRYALSNPETIIVNESITYKAMWILQYLVVVNSNLPVFALINGSNITLTTGWYDQLSNVKILNTTKYVNSSVRYAIYNVTPAMSFELKGPLNVSVKYVPQYLVIINNKTYWVFNGSKVTLYEILPFYLQGKWEGTYQLPNNSSITITSLVREKLVTKLDFLNIVSTSLVLISLLLLTIEGIRRR